MCLHRGADTPRAGTREGLAAPSVHNVPLVFVCFVTGCHYVAVGGLALLT